MGSFFVLYNKVASIARKAVLEHEFAFAGLIGMIDPPRCEAEDDVAQKGDAWLDAGHIRVAGSRNIHTFSTNIFNTNALFFTNLMIS
ncbi:MAG: hypothetical protein KDJ52_02805 [Anaerolineae bacterium]|nr:hypothetical protein [Anaerolineae bacterium]